MRLSVKTCTLALPYEEMLDFCVKQGVKAVEIGTGNWSGAPHMDLESMLASADKRARWIGELEQRGVYLK